MGQCECTLCVGFVFIPYSWSEVCLEDWVRLFLFIYILPSYFLTSKCSMFLTLPTLGLSWLKKSLFLSGLRSNQRHPLSRSHMSAWASIWAEGRMDMSGNSELAQLSYSSLYYILSCLPSGGDASRTFGGVSLGGLAYGELAQVSWK